MCPVHFYFWFRHECGIKSSGQSPSVYGRLWRASVPYGIPSGEGGVSMPIRVVVTGATGKMSREVLNAVERDPEFQPVGAVSRSAGSATLTLPSGATTVPLVADCAQLLERVKPDVLIDFTNAEGAMQYGPLALAQGVAFVTGSTGLSEADVAELRDLSQSSQTGIVIAPNFALGAVLMTHLARVAAPFFSHAEALRVPH